MDCLQTIATLKDIALDIASFSHGEMMNRKEAEEKVKTIGEVVLFLEKQIEKLPIGISLTHEGRVGNCPNCKVLLSEPINTAVCICGQKITWKKP